MPTGPPKTSGIGRPLTTKDKWQSLEALLGDDRNLRAPRPVPPISITRAECHSVQQWLAQGEPMKVAPLEEVQRPPAMAWPPAFGKSQAGPPGLEGQALGGAAKASGGAEQGRPPPPKAPELLTQMPPLVAGRINLEKNIWAQWIHDQQNDEYHLMVTPDQDDLLAANPGARCPTFSLGQAKGRPLSKAMPLAGLPVGPAGPPLELPEWGLAPPPGLSPRSCCSGISGATSFDPVTSGISAAYSFPSTPMAISESCWHGVPEIHDTEPLPKCHPPDHHVPIEEPDSASEVIPWGLLTSLNVQDVSGQFKGRPGLACLGKGIQVSHDNLPAKTIPDGDGPSFLDLMQGVGGRTWTRPPEADILDAGVSHVWVSAQTIPDGDGPHLSALVQGDSGHNSTCPPETDILDGGKRYEPSHNVFWHVPALPVASPPPKTPPLRPLPPKAAPKSAIDWEMPEGWKMPFDRPWPHGGVAFVAARKKAPPKLKLEPPGDVITKSPQPPGDVIKKSPPLAPPVPKKAPPKVRMPEPLPPCEPQDTDVIEPVEAMPLAGPDETTSDPPSLISHSPVSCHAQDFQMSDSGVIPSDSEVPGGRDSDRHWQTKLRLYLLRSHSLMFFRGWGYWFIRIFCQDVN